MSPFSIVVITGIPNLGSSVLHLSQVFVYVSHYIQQKDKTNNKLMHEMRGRLFFSPTKMQH